MQLFHKIEGGVAIVRAGIYMKQADVYVRGERVFIKAGGGFLRITAKFGDVYSTSHPSTAVVEIEAEGVEDVRGELRFKGTK